MDDGLEIIRHTRVRVKNDGLPGADRERYFTVPRGQLRNGTCKLVKPTLSIASNDKYQSTGQIEDKV